MKAILVAFAVLAAACVPRVDQPQVWLEGARLASLGLTGGVVDVRLSVYNPNRFAVEARGMTYDLALHDIARDQWFDFTEGRIDGPLAVAGGDTLEVVMPVEFSYRGLGDALRGLIERGSFDYRVNGVVELAAPIRRDIQYQHTGRYSPGGGS